MIRSALMRAAIAATLLAATAGLASGQTPELRGPTLPAADSPAVTRALLQQSPGGATLTFDLNEPLAVEAFLLANPARAIVDLPEARFLIDPGVGRNFAHGRARGLVRSYRFGNLAQGRSRIVIDLGGPAKILRAEARKTDAGGAAQLTIELAPDTDAAFRAASREGQRKLAAIDEAHARARPRPETPPPGPQGLPVVVIDPGHGGPDTGARAGETLEKTVVFDFARVLAARIDRGGHARAELTRSDDVFIPLADRAKIGQNAGAALFLSIHADTLGGAAYVHGATVYTLSDRASDAVAARLEASENAADKAGGVAASEEQTDVHDILFDLTRRETRLMSRTFANYLAERLKAASDLNKNPIRSAGFRVLKAPDVPAALLELGYLSSKQDLAQLTSQAWREKTADAVAAAIERYIDARPRTEGEAVSARAGPIEPAH
ncbi:MAG: N-acetylmuramoyl-L-alanine amidase [Hyphomicrobiales bacterium]|nr:N-acetylmuramoyl-L-alanine amidase [Hyphomicrobiales bacterium]